MAGVAPETTQYLASLANQFLLPEPSNADQFDVGFTLKVSTYEMFDVNPKPSQS
jgi:hypothetical protein